MCCDLYGNEGTNWEPFCIADQYGVNGNISEDPLFCDPGIDDVTLYDISPCAPFSPPNEECDLIGAWPVGCGEAGIADEWPPADGDAVSVSWGEIKGLFRR